MTKCMATTNQHKRSKFVSGTAIWQQKKISGKNGKVNTNGAEQRFLVRLILENKLCFYFSLFYHFCCCCFFLPLNVILVDCQGIWEMQTCRDTHNIFWLTYIYAHCSDSTLRSNSFIKFFLFLHSCGVNSLWMRDVTVKKKLNVPLQCEMVSMQNQDIKRTDKMLGLEGFSGVSPYLFD